MGDELSPSQAAARIGATTRSVQRWIASGKLPARRVGGRWRVASDVIDAFVAPRGDAPDAAADVAPDVAAIAPRNPIRILFIANRGEIATRIARTCDRLGIGAIVPPTDGSGGLDLLDATAVVSAARAAMADALHPGFGFLAENADFAEAVLAAGIRWVGPPPAAIRAMGDKAAARRLAASMGIPIIPGYDDEDQSNATLVSAAAAIGLPLIVKPAAGGGGKGMRTVRDSERLSDALAAARREAMAAFGDDRLILERLVEGARHVEIQVLFDAHGTGIQLGERDCSIQRRHQKVLEESPSPAVGVDLRARLGEAALSLARAVGYVSAGTCEFLLDDRGQPAFLEMNTRLQVEHPVTELVTGRDLVADQLRIAAGERLEIGTSEAGRAVGHDVAIGGHGVSAAGRAVSANGHAVEVRLYAEDAEDGFLPATGRVERLDWPAGDGIRVDAGIELGSEIGGRFDPMLAKIIAWGPDRPAAFERLTYALDETVALGVVTNLRFLRWLVRQPVVLAGEARTDTLDRIWPPDDWPERVTIPAEAWAVAAASLVADPDPRDAWAGGWRLNAARSVRVEANGLTRSVRVGPRLQPGIEAGFEAVRAEDEAGFEAVRAEDVVHLDLAGRSVAFRMAAPLDVDAAARAAVAHGVVGSTGPAEIVAPMPGTVLHVHVKVGAAVAAGDPIVTLEAMKMEHLVAATIAGRIGDLRVRPADQVARGQLLAVIEP